jgi:hypothetical protein
MARALKDTQGNGKARKAKQAKERIAEQPGVSVDPTDGPMFTEALSLDEIMALQQKLIAAIGVDEDEEAEFQEFAKDYRKAAKGRRSQIRLFARQIRKGVREIPAQQTFPVLVPDQTTDERPRADEVAPPLDMPNPELAKDETEF